ncbi:hypothetical protein ACE1TI_20735 [Alteribacillus sp. JSM 102045]|uniref:hypothetical protein n=1 Tax=Alteribacillus sp. JSM 102045 TaxID=1562101 RepID=UPI0035C03F14
MDLSSFREAMFYQSVFLAYDETDVDKLIQLAKTDRRVRNYLVWYLLAADDETRGQYAAEMVQWKREVFTALKKIQKHPHARREAKELARELLAQFHPPHPPEIKRTEYGVPDEMAKAFTTVVNHFMIKKEETPEQRAYVEEKMASIDWENLFVKKKRSNHEG